MATIAEHAPRKFTVDEYLLASRAGAFGHDRTELIDGAVYVMPPTSPDHDAPLLRLNHLLVLRLDGRAHVLPTSSLLLSRHSMPEPDFAIARVRDDAYGKMKIAAADLFAVVEVSVTSLSFDRSKKAEAYARAGVPEYWIVDSPGRRIEVLRAPALRGYAERTAFAPGERLSFDAFPDVAFSVDEIVGGGERA